VCPMTLAAAPDDAQVATVEVNQTGVPVAASVQNLGLFVLEGLEDGSVTIAPASIPDVYAPADTVGAVAKDIVDAYVRLDSLSYTECYENMGYTVRCDHGPLTTGVRRIRIQNFLYNHPSDCDLVWTNPIAQVVSTSNCTVLGSSVIRGSDTGGLCGDTIYDQDDPGQDGRFDVLLNVNVLSPARFTVYVSLQGTLWTWNGAACVPCS
jgi:hypothetical protein